MTNPQTKVIYLPTNHNNKLACECITHVDIAPAGLVTESRLQNTIIEIRTQDNSFPPCHWQLVDLLRLPLQKLDSVITWPSHGLQSYDFIKWFLQKNANTTVETPVSVYFYQRHHA